MKSIMACIAIAAIALLGAGPTAAASVGGASVGDASVGGVSFPHSAVISEGLPQLTLNGAGLRKKFIIKVYAGALYLTSKSADPRTISAMPGPKRVLMHFIYDGVEAGKLVEAWRDGFEKNLSGPLHASMKPRIERFCAMFTEQMKKGDEIRLDLLPGKGTMVYVKEHFMGQIEGDDFYNDALLRIWLGPEPPDEGIKRGMLGLK